MLGTTEASPIDEEIFHNFIERKSIYEDIYQNEKMESLEEVLRMSEHDRCIASEITCLRVAMRGCQTIQPPQFHKNGTNLIVPLPINIAVDSE